MARSKSLEARRRSRGSTLIEALIAVAVLGMGTAGIAGLITTISGANRRLAFQRRANEVFSQFAAQVADARCDCVGPACPGADLDLDPALDPGFAGAFLFPGDACALPAGSTLTICGDQANWTPPVETSGPPLQLSYTSVLYAPPVAIPGAPPAYDLLVRVREIRNVADENLVADAPWVREYPLKKVCNLRMEPTGRGEF